MSTMFVVGYDDKYKATEVLHSLQRMEEEYLSPCPVKLIAHFGQFKKICRFAFKPFETRD